MKNLVYLNRFIVLLGLMSIVALACESPQSNSFSYKVDPITFSGELSSIYQITPDEAMELMYDSSLAIFIDIRNRYDFEKGHLENAINIPIPELLNPENKALFDRCLKDSLTLVLYGKDELEANAPWMLIYELGYSNARLLLGGYSYIDRMYLDQLELNESYHSEIAKYDYSGIIAKVIAEKAKPIEIKKEKKVEVKKKVIVEEKPKKAAEGGC